MNPAQEVSEFLNLKTATASQTSFILMKHEISNELNIYCGHRPHSIFTEDYHGREVRQIDRNVRKVATPVTSEMKTTDRQLRHPKYYQDLIYQ
jgi:hypothetical protein